MPDVDEDADTLEGNARLKAVAIATRQACRRSPTTPASRSTPSAARPACTRPATRASDATYADNVTLLLESLKGVPPSSALPASARSRWCAGPTGERWSPKGSCDGHIALEPRGERGFGYDPVFVPDEGDGRTFAEMSADEKHELSHRGRAFRALAAELG